VASSSSSSSIFKDADIWCELGVVDASCGELRESNVPCGVMQSWVFVNDRCEMPPHFSGESGSVSANAMVPIMHAISLSITCFSFDFLIDFLDFLIDGDAISLLPRYRDVDKSGSSFKYLGGLDDGVPVDRFPN